MDFKVSILDQIKENYKPLLILLSGTALVFLISKYFKARSCESEEKDPGRELPTVEDIQRFIEELPLDISQLENNQEGLKELIGELSEISEDEEWKELVASLKKFYEEGSVV